MLMYKSDDSFNFLLGEKNIYIVTGTRMCVGGGGGGGSVLA